jgi:carboxypeptidase T
MTTAPSPNASALQTLGRKFAYFNRYTPQQSNVLYGTDGDTTEYAYGTLGIAAYTFELGAAFFQACSNFDGTIYPSNLPALIYAAKVARTPYQTPLGPDALNLSL